MHLKCNRWKSWFTVEETEIQYNDGYHHLKAAIDVQHFEMNKKIEPKLKVE